jgi:hypothetical protein
MWRSWKLRSRIALLAAFALGCSPGEPIEPPPVGPLDIFLGDTTPTLTLDSGQLSRAHYLTLGTATEVAVFVQALDSAVRLRIFVDGIDYNVTAGPYAVGPVLLANRTDRFFMTAGQTLNVFVSRRGTQAAVPMRYRLFVYPVNRDPEHVSGTLALEEVREGEDLETSADIDEYAFAGQQGKDLIAYLSNLGPADAGSFHLQFFEQAGGQELGGVSAPGVGVPLDQAGSALFTVPEGPHGVRVEGIVNLPSSYTFVVRLANAGPVARAGVQW